MNLFDPIVAAIFRAIPDLAPEDIVFAPAPNRNAGDIALRLFQGAKRLGMAPSQLAARVVNEVAFGPEVREAVAAGPYVNFRVNRGMLCGRVTASVMESGARYGSDASGVGRSALVEHTSINPNASPHVGRARNAMIGDGLVRLLRFEGYDVEVHYYVNDMGRQIGLLVLTIEERCGEIVGGERPSIAFDDVLQAYVDANQKAEADAEFAAKGYELLARMEDRDPETQAKFNAVTGLCLDGQLAILSRLGVSYDVFDHESAYVRDPRLDTLVEALRAREAVFVDEEERLVADLSKLGREYEEGRYFVLMRANGSSLYGYRDLAYTISKMDKGADVNIIVLGEDHKMYFEQLSMILGAGGNVSPEPLYYAYILLKDGKMSTRQGKVVLLSDFLDEAQSRSIERVREQCHDLSVEEQDAIAAKVAVAAIRFAILRVNPNKNVVFDWETSLSFTGDTGPYVQYSCARMASILRKFGDVSAAVDQEFPTETDAEWELCLKLASFPDVVAAAVRERSCAAIAQFALDSARQFTAFYHDCPVLDAPEPALRTARAQICASARQTISNALAILGIEALERM